MCGEEDSDSDQYDEEDDNDEDDDKEHVFNEETDVDYYGVLNLKRDSTQAEIREVSLLIVFAFKNPVI